MKRKVLLKKILSMIEEYNPESTYLTDDPDISAKIDEVINQVMMELVRLKKLPQYLTMPVTMGQLLTMKDLSAACSKEIYQIDVVRGVKYVTRAGGTVLKFLESGTAEIDCFVFPERITEENANGYEFDLPADLLEILPYGVAADLLKSDQSAEYGSVYATRYETFKQQLDPRYQMPGIYIDGGVRL